MRLWVDRQRVYLRLCPEKRRKKNLVHKGIVVNFNSLVKCWPKITQSPVAAQLMKKDLSSDLPGTWYETPCHYWLSGNQRLAGMRKSIFISNAVIAIYKKVLTVIVIKYSSCYKCSNCHNYSNCYNNWMASRKSVITDSKDSISIITDYVTSPNAQTIDAIYHNRLWHEYPLLIHVDAKYHYWQFIVSWDGENQASVRMQSIITDYHILLPVHFSHSLNCLFSYDTFPLTWTGFWTFVGYDNLPINPLIIEIVINTLNQVRWNKYIN